MIAGVGVEPLFQGVRRHFHCLEIQVGDRLATY
jgi:hypothetical protein